MILKVCLFWKWSAELARSASAHAETCKIGYNPLASLRSFVGQTIGFHSSNVPISEFLFICTVFFYTIDKVNYDCDVELCL